MESSPRHFGYFLGFGSDNSQLVVARCHQLLPIQGPLQQRDLLIETVTVIKLKPLDVEYLHVKCIGYGEDASLRVTGYDGWWIDFDLSVLKGFEIGTDELFFGEGKHILLVER